MGPGFESLRVYEKEQYIIWCCSFFILLFTKSAFVLEIEKEKDASETRDIRSGASFFDKRALN